MKPIINYSLFSIALSFIYLVSFGQENSPFSRYGIGDVYPQQNITSRGMGGVSAAYTSTQAVNTINPASYGSLRLVTYDFALSVDSRSLLSATPAGKFNSINFLPSYLQLGMPLNKKINGATLVFGLRPATRINYSVEEGSRINYDSLGTSDSLHQLHEGNGGMNQVFLGLGKTWRSKDTTKSLNSFAVGFNFGYEWGTKFISTQLDFPSDSIYENWYRSNSTDSVHYWGVFLNPGLMGTFTLNEVTDPISKIRSAYTLSIGASGTIEQNLNASRDVTRETFFRKDDGSLVPIDSIYKTTGEHGKINIPLSAEGGFMINKMVINGPFIVKKWGIGADYSFQNWSKYLYFGQPDQLNDSWMLRVGAEFSANPITGKSVFSTGYYRVGYYMGKDYINADGNGYKVRAVTLGYSFNLRKYHSYDNQYTMINTAIEIGKRGSSVNNITENFFKFSLGLSLSDIWFIKRKYD
ncbi:MAG: hypothetical protein JO072_06780 [Parafilimonas sp.]|nr:hypothetical protein [Parafilimonas sp.]